MLSLIKTQIYRTLHIQNEFPVEKFIDMREINTALTLFSFEMNKSEKFAIDCRVNLPSFN